MGRFGTRDIRARLEAFRRLQPIAPYRYCQMVLREVEQISADRSKGAHKRYLAIYRLIERKDRDLARAFNDMRRSTAFVQIAIIRQYGMITDEQVARFCDEPRGVLELLSGPRD